MVGFCYSNLRRETGGLELASTITLVLQANRLIKYTSHPKKLRHFLKGRDISQSIMEVKIFYP